MNDAIRVALRGDHRLFVEGIEALLRADASLRVVGEGDSPEVLLLDARTEGLLDQVRTESERCRVLLIGAEDDPDWAAGALQAGSRGILERGSGSEDLLKAIRLVHEGQVWARRGVISRLVESVSTLPGGSKGPTPAAEPRLSGREHEVASLAAEGLSNKEIAQSLSISEATVKAHLTNIFRKLGVRGRGYLAALYHRAFPVAGAGRAARGGVGLRPPL